MNYKNCYNEVIRAFYRVVLHQKLTGCRKIRVINLFIISILLLHACKKTDAGQAPPVVPPTPSVSYQKINLASATQIQVVQKSTWQYELTTTGKDPHLSLEALLLPNNPDSVVLTFEYQCSADIGDVQIFFGSPITEVRSVKPGTIPAKSGWGSYSVDLGSSIRQFNWGSAGDFLRLDFGTQSGVTLQIRNIYLRSLNAAEKVESLAREELIKNDLLLESNLKKYLETNYPSRISEVKVSTASIHISGNYAGTGEFSLCEIRPYDHLTQISKFANKFPQGSAIFSVDIDRFVVSNGLKYDRILSKWVIAKSGSTADEIVSHAMYATQIAPLQTMVAKRPSGKKGLGGYSINRGFESDLDDLNISSITVNITPTSFMYTQSRANAIAHLYGDKTWYFDKAQVDVLDRTMQSAKSRNIVVAAIILIQKASQCADPEVGRLLQHPSFTSEGIFTMPNLTTPESVSCYAAALDFLASRYCRTDNAYGRIHHWIMHNEVDAGLSWTNMGDKPVTVYTDTYIKSMRMCYNIARQYDQNSEVFASFTHSWAKAVQTRFYAVKDMLKILLGFSVAEGDFQWGLAYHSYPENLFEPKIWNDVNATFSMNSPLITFKNLEVLNAWIKKSENYYLGTTRRTVWLSENGTNSKTYSDQDLKEQAAGFAYAWKKLKTLDGVDAFQWHNWIDNRHEGGLRIGLRRFPDDTEAPGGKKPVWYAYQAASTAQEDVVFEPYKLVIGIQNWSEILYTSPIP